MKFLILAFIFSSFSLEAMELVPKSVLTSESPSKKSFKTAKGTLVTLEYDPLGRLEDASGKSIDNGDVFTPGEGNIDLQGAVASLKKAGKIPSGEWTYEKAFVYGWIYEIEGRENGQKMEYKIKAATGELISATADQN